MSAPSKVNKENFRLLDLSSDEESEDLHLEIIPSRKKKITRRERNRVTAPQLTEPSIGSEVQCAFKWALRGTLLLWLLMLTWICAALYDQVSTMETDIAKVSTSSQNVDDTLQICHMKMKELATNTSEMSNRIAKLEQNNTELVQRLDQATKELAEISNQLSAAPKLVETPRQLADLQRTVANIGSQINGFDGAVNSARRTAVAASTGVGEIRTLLHNLEAKTNETIANVTANIKRDEDIKNEIATLNSTLVTKIDTLEVRIQEINKPASTIAPTPTAPIISNNTLTNTTIMQPAAPTQPPGPPVKPSILQS